VSGFVSYSLLEGIALKSVIVLGAGWLAARLLQKKSSAMRHAVWSAAFAALLAMPVLSISLPALRLPVKGSLLGAGFVFHAASSAATDEPVTAGKRTSTGPAGEGKRPRLDWQGWAMLLWATGSAISSAQMLAGWAAVARLRRAARPMPVGELTALAEGLGVRDDVEVRGTPRGSMPITYGFRRAVIFLPAELAEWSPERRRMILLHELAHVLRGDCAIQLIARMVLSLYWWNPLTWISWREFLKERELAADDVVLGAGAGAAHYASHLLAVARSMGPSPAVGSAAVAMARRSQLEGRLLAILDAKRDRRSVAGLSLATIVVVAIGLAAPLATLQARSDASEGPVNASAANASSFAALIESGDAAREGRQFAEAKTRYNKALAAAGSAADTATALLRLGTVELSMKNGGQAITDFEQAMNADAAKTGEAKMWMAIAQASQNNLEAAEGFYEGALAAEDPNSAAAATTMELYGQLLQREGKTDEAKSMLDRASAVRRTQAEQAVSANRPSGPGVRRIGGETKAPMLVSKVEPEYSEEARLAKYQGSTLLSVEIGADGLARNIRVIRGLGLGLDQKAIEAVKQWRFQPGVADGQPVTTAAQIEVNFRLL
jgi:TonB family protein